MLLLMQFSVCAQGLQTINMSSIERSFYSPNTCIICAIFLYHWMQYIDGFNLLLQRYVRKGTDAKNPAILSFSLLLKEPIKIQHMCRVAREFETLCCCLNLPICNDPVIIISSNFATNSSKPHIYHGKSEFWYRELLVIQNMQ